MNIKSYIENHPFSIVIVFFVFIYIWQPFFAGMYSDDWVFLISYFTETPNISAPFSLDRLTHFMTVYANRPMSGIMFYLVNSICGHNIALVHTFMLSWILAALYSYYLFTREFFEFLSIRKASMVATLTALIWLVSPWTLGVTAWFSSSINLISFIFFSLSLNYLFRGLRLGKHSFAKVGLFYLLSVLTYESFFFQYFIFIAIAWLFIKEKGIDKKVLINHFIILSVIVAMTVIWNRIAPSIFDAVINKVINPYFLQTLVVNIVSFPYVLIASFGVFELLALAVFVPTIIYFIIKLKRNAGGLKPLFRTKKFKILLLLASGIFAGFFLYSAAGYTMWGMGSRSRTMFVASFYIPLIVVIIAAKIAQLNSISRVMKTRIAFTLFTLSFAALLVNKFDWIEAEREQKDVIMKFPAEQVDHLDTNDMVVIVAPFRHQWISQFDAPWSIKNQMRYGKSFYEGDELVRATDSKFVVGRGVVHPVSGEHYQIYWDGELLYQGYGLEEEAKKIDKNFYYNRAESFTAKRLYIWNYYDDTLEQITEPRVFEYEPYYNYDYWVTWIYKNWVK
ncbi:MAG: hypothetical protein KDC55_10430 [Ignavibacteriae bacterium]|nr:hypothetical protein [Ignavibacteriota bacterium]